MIKAGFLLASAFTALASDYCWKDKYTRTGGVNPGCPPGTQYMNDRCYEPCQPDYGASGTTCIANCRDGYASEGMNCIARADLYGKGCCCTIFSKNCCSNCRPTYTDIGCLCTRPQSGYGRASYQMPVRDKICQGGAENYNGQCFQPCKSGYQRLMNECWSTCPKGFENCGNACAKTKADCSDKIIEVASKGNALTLSILNTITDPSYFAIAQKATRLREVKHVSKKTAEAVEKYIQTVIVTAKKNGRKLSHHEAKDLVENSLAQSYEALYDKKLSAEAQVEKAWATLLGADPDGALTAGKAFSHPMCAEMKNNDASGEGYRTKEEKHETTKHKEHHGKKDHDSGKKVAHEKHGKKSHGQKKHSKKHGHKSTKKHSKKHSKKHGHKSHKRHGHKSRKHHGHKRHGHKSRKHHGKYHGHRHHEECDAQLPTTTPAQQ